jgi:hypothetical protein
MVLGCVGFMVCSWSEVFCWQGVLERDPYTPVEMSKSGT